MDTFLLAAQLLLAVIFATAAVGKLLDLPGSRKALVEFGVPEGAAHGGGVLLPLLELAAAGALSRSRRPAGARSLALALLLAFIGGIASALRQGRKPDCHCFGQLHSAPAGADALVRNGVLAALAAVVAVGGAGTAPDDWVAARTGAELIAVGSSIATVVLAALVLKGRRDLKLALTTLEDTQLELASIPPGLPMGAPAPPFSLLDLAGEIRTLDELRRPGLPVLLVFTGPDCGACKDLFPEVARWQSVLSDRLTVAVISNGDHDANLAVAHEHGLQNVLLQNEWELMEVYRLQATPTGILVNVDGTIASTPALGGVTIEPLVRMTLSRNQVPAAVAPTDA